MMTRGGCNDRSAVPSAACWASPSPSSSGIRRSAPAILYLLLLGLALSPPGSSAAPKDCTGPTKDRGWLGGQFNGIANPRHHPVWYFGPSQLHGKTELVPSATGAFAIEFQDASNGSKVTDAYYPNRNYTIQLTCVSSCAFLATVEEGITSISSEDQWRGRFLAPAMAQGAYTGNEYSGQVGRYGAARSSTTLSQSYAIMWQAPPALTYLGLTVRITVVVDNTTTCEGFFREIPVRSLVVCGDGLKDDLEACDDDNLLNSDGCNATCGIELGWTCAEFLPGTKTSKCTRAKVVFQPTSLLVSVEEGRQVTYSMSLSTFLAPGRFVYIEVQDDLLSTAGRSLSVVGASNFTFDDTTNPWNVSQTVTISSSNNDMIDGARDAMLSHRVSSDDPNFAEFYRGVVPNMMVRVTDNDVPGLRVTKRSLTVHEDGASDSYSISLGTQPVPGSSVAVTITSPSSNQFRTVPNRVLFTPLNWNVPQVVSVYAVDNFIVDGTVSTVLDHNVSAVIAGLDDAYNTFDATDCCQLTVEVGDNDAPGLTVTPRDLSLTEGQNGTYIIQTRTQPLHTVYVNFTSSTPSLRVTAADGTAGVAITRLGYRTSHVVTVHALNNDMVNTVWELPLGGSMTHTLSSADTDYAALNATSAAPWAVQVTIKDDDFAGLRRPETITVTEGTPTEIEMSLPTLPKSKVTLYLSLNDTSYLKVEGDTTLNRQGEGASERLSVEWEASQWQQVRRVRVLRAENDLTDSGQRTTSLQYAMESLDASYSGVAVKDSVVIVVDDDKAGVTVTPSTGFTLTEGGATSQVTVTLDSMPQLFEGNQSRDVVVRLVHDVQVAVTPAEITFVRANYSAVGVFTIRAVDDTTIEESQHLSLLRFQIVTGDTEYQKVVVPDKIVTIVDNDKERLTVGMGKWGGVMSLTVPYGAVILSVPPGALSNDTKLVLRESLKPLPAGTAGTETSLGQLRVRRVGGSYEFKPHGTTFATPVTIAIEYDEAAAALVGGKLHMLVCLNGTDGPWSVVEEVTFAGGVASVQSTHFSTYYVAAGAVAAPPAEAPPPPPAPAPCRDPDDTGVSDVEWGIIAAFILENLVLAVVGTWVFVKRATAVKPQVLPLIEYSADGKPLALPAPMVGIAPGAGGGVGLLGPGPGVGGAYGRAVMGVSNEPVLLPGPYDGQPNLTPALVGVVGEGKPWEKQV